MRRLNLAVAVYAREVDDRVLTFELDGTSVVDQETGSNSRYEVCSNDTVLYPVLSFRSNDP